MNTMTIISGATPAEMEIAVKAILEERDKQTRQAQIRELEKVLNATITTIYELGGSITMRGGEYLHSWAKLMANGESSSYAGKWKVQV